MSVQRLATSSLTAALGFLLIESGSAVASCDADAPQSSGECVDSVAPWWPIFAYMGSIIVVGALIWLLVRWYRDRSEAWQP